MDILHENLKKIFETQEKVELNTLTLLGLDKISAYIALLFLTADPEANIDLYQEEFYGELYAVPYQKSEEEKETPTIIPPNLICLDLNTLPIKI